MGLKFRRFKAKLNWKTKETVPEVVCLRYQIHSEFKDPLPLEVPTTSSNVIKQKKIASKPPVQNVFDVTKLANANNGIATTKSEPVQPKGILKKVEVDTNLSAIPQEHLKSSTDDNKKSALIFMTENHDETEEPTNTPLAPKNDEIVELRQKDNPVEPPELIVNNDHRSSTSSSDSEVDAKTVRWRETVIEIKLDKPESEVITEQPDDFKVHFARHTNFSANKRQQDSDVEEAEADNEDKAEVNTSYRSRGAYSSQAASIFFAGEEPEPTPRLRNNSEPNDSDKDNK